MREQEATHDSRLLVAIALVQSDSGALGGPYIVKRVVQCLAIPETLTAP